MDPRFLVYRRDTPDGRVVMIAIEELEPGDVIGRLHVERRTDPDRRIGSPPVIAETRRETRTEVLRELRRLAENDVEITRRLDAWLAERRVQMADSQWWSIERRHEMAQLARSGASSGARRLFLFFRGRGGAFRRLEIPEDYPADAGDDDLRSAWSRAEILQ
jgi:hypothetical protein